MKIHASTLPAPRGTLMVFALLIMLVATLFIAGTASLMTNRATQSSYMDLFMKRRIAMENSKSFNQELMLEKTFLTSTTVAGSLVGLFPDDWGGIHTSDGWTNMRIFTPNLIPSEQTTAYPYNYGGLRPSGSFIATERTVRPAALDGAGNPYGGIDAFSAYSFLKSFPPTLSGDGLVVFRKPTAAAGQIEIGDSPTGPLRIRVLGRTVIRDPDSLFAPSTPSPLEMRIYSDNLYIQKHTDRLIYARDTSANKIPPSNLPAVRSTLGPNAETITTSDLFAGSLDVINNPTHPDNSLWHFMDREQTAGRTGFTEINSSDPIGAPTDPVYIIHYNPSDTGNLPPYMPPTYDTSPLAFPNPYRILYINLDHANLTHLRLNASFDQIVLVGQVGATAYNAAALMPPIIIAGLTSVSTGYNRYMHCAHENNRRIVFAVGDTNASPLDMYWVGSSVSSTAARWRMVLINQYRTITMFLPSPVTKSVTLTGGVMTNWTVKRSGSGAASRLTFAPDNNPEPAGATGPKFSTLIPREAWMENYFFPTPP